MSFRPKFSKFYSSIEKNGPSLFLVKAADAEYMTPSSRYHQLMCSPHSMKAVPALTSASRRMKPVAIPPFRRRITDRFFYLKFHSLIWLFSRGARGCLILRLPPPANISHFRNRRLRSQRRGKPNAQIPELSTYSTFWHEPSLEHPRGQALEYSPGPPYE